MILMLGSGLTLPPVNLVSLALTELPLLLVSLSAHGDAIQYVCPHCREHTH